MDESERTYICIDLKSFYASVECVARGLDPLKANLLVADESRTDKTICLAVSPALKTIGVSSRPRLFEAKQAIRDYERSHHRKVEYIVAVPRMGEYLRTSSKIYEIYRKYVAEMDIHVYSIDECFIDVTPYLDLYRKEAEKEHISPAHFMAITMIRDVLKETKITATVGIGTNLYLAKVGMDIVAKKTPPDKDGVRIAELTEESYRLLLWQHKPLTDFWQIGPGKCNRLNKHGLYTMGDVALESINNEEFFYKEFGIDGELMIDHAWGIEPTLMSDIKAYKSTGKSLSTGQVLSRPYKFQEARVIFQEMIDKLVSDLVSKDLTAGSMSFWISYDPESLEVCRNYTGSVSMDFYGRLHPSHTGGAVRLPMRTNSYQVIEQSLLEAFDLKVDYRLLIRRLGIAAEDVRKSNGVMQMDMFTDYDAMEKERKIQRAMLSVRQKYGKNAILKGYNFLDGATMKERNEQIGGHRA